VDTVDNAILPQISREQEYDDRKEDVNNFGLNRSYQQLKETSDSRAVYPQVIHRNPHVIHSTCPQSATERTSSRCDNRGASTAKSPGTPSLAKHTSEGSNRGETSENLQTSTNGQPIRSKNGATTNPSSTRRPRNDAKSFQRSILFKLGHSAKARKNLMIKLTRGMIINKQKAG
jgi:hypothetical protein